MSVVQCDDGSMDIQKSAQSKFVSSRVKQELAGNRPPPLKINRESHRIRKASLPLPVVQYKQPVIIHTYSPKVITTEPSNFRWLVQLLTGSSDTRSRCKKNKPTESATESCPSAANDTSAAVVANTTDIVDMAEETQAALEGQNSLSSTVDGESLILESSTESEDFLLTDTATVICDAASDYTSPRGPLPPFDTVFALSGGANLPWLLSPSGNTSSQSLIQLTELPREEITRLPAAQALASSLPSPNILPPGFLNDLPFMSPGVPLRFDGVVSPKISPFKGNFISQNRLSPFTYFHSEEWDNSFLECFSSPSDSTVHKDMYQF